MPAPELPDDPREWPADPFALLGVEPGASEAEIRRAYARLIRRFKPEHAPEQFRRIREAYEACLSTGRWFFSPPPDRPPAESAASRPEPPPEPAPEVLAEPPRTPPADEASGLWSAACDGRAAEAYAGLAELAASRPASPDPALRLYWLLALNPSLDPGRTRHHWLAEALARSRLKGPVVELYRRELEANAEAALLPPYTELLAADAEPADLLTVARRRVAAAGRAECWFAATADLRALRERVPGRDEVGWLALVVEQLGWAAWTRPDPVYTAARAELDRLRHLELRCEGFFDRVDETEHLAADWRAVEVRDVPDEVLELIRRGWAGNGDVRPADVFPAVAAVAADAVRNLQRFDRVLQDRGPGLLVVLLRLLDSYRRSRPSGSGPEYPPELLRGVLRARVGRRDPDDPRFRTELPEVLAAEAVGLPELAAACAADPDPWFRALAGRLRADLSLHLVCLATGLHQG